MADISVERKSGGTTWLWALLAVAAVVGLMIWLYTQSQQVESTAALAGDTTEVAPPEAAATGELVELSAIAMAPDTYAGRTLQVEDVPVAATLGPQAFWGDVPGQNPFLVVLGEGAQGAEPVAAGQTYTVVGTVQPVDEAALEQWVESGALSEAQRDEASFATHAIVAEDATVTGEADDEDQ